MTFIPMSGVKRARDLMTNCIYLEDELTTVSGIQIYGSPWYIGLSTGSGGIMLIRGGEISKMYTCPRTTGCKKALVRTNALLARTQINTKARFVNIMIK